MSGISLKEKARAMYQELPSIDDIAQELKTAPSNVRRWCDDLRGDELAKVEKIKVDRDKVVLEMRAEARAALVVTLPPFTKKYGWGASAVRAALLGKTYAHLNDQSPPIAAINDRTKVREEARRLYTEGKTYDQIKTILGFNKSTISDWCTDLVPAQKRSVRNGPSRSALRKAKLERETALKTKVREMYVSGKTITEVSQELGLDDKRLARWCKDLIDARRKDPTLRPRKKSNRTSNGPQILTNDQVVELRKLVRASGTKNWPFYADKYGVSLAVVSMAATGLTFKQVDAIEPPIRKEEVKRYHTPRGKNKVTRVGPPPKISDELVQQLIAKRRLDPAIWTYGELARWLNTKVDVNFRAGPMSVFLLKRDPSLKELEAVKVPPKPKVKSTKKPTPRPLKVLSVEELQRRAREERELEEAIAAEDALEAWVAAGKPYDPVYTPFYS